MKSCSEWPLNVRMRSPTFMPAFCAGDCGGIDCRPMARRHVEADQEQQHEDDRGARMMFMIDAGRDDDHPCADRTSGCRRGDRRLASGFRSSWPEHLHVAAERDPVQAIFGFAQAQLLRRRRSSCSVGEASSSSRSFSCASPQSMSLDAVFVFLLACCRTRKPMPFRQANIACRIRRRTARP